MINVIRKSAIFNLLGQLLPALALFIVTPILVRGLGLEGYGIFAIILLLIDYFGFFDIGIGGAATKYIAEALAKNETRRVSELYKASLWTSVGFSALAAVCFFVFVPLVSKFFIKTDNIEVINSVIPSLKLSSLVIFFILLRGVFKGVLEAHKRFDIINLIVIPVSVAAQVAFAVAVVSGHALKVIVLILLGKEAVMTCLLWYYAKKQISLDENGTIGRVEFIDLIKFGAHLSVTRLITWFMNSFDKFIISFVLSTAILTYYVIPFGAASKIAIIAGCIAPVMFPVSSQLYVSNRAALVQISNKAVTYAALLMGLPTILLILFAKEIMLFWMGEGFLQSVIVLQVLAVGSFFSAISWVLGSLIQGVGHAKTVMLVGILMLPVEVTCLYFFTRLFGLVGASTSWSVMRTVTVGVFLFLCSRHLRILDFEWVKKKKFIVANISVVLIVTACLLIKLMSGHALVTIINVSVLLLGYTIIIIYYCFESQQISRFFSFVK